MTIKRIGWIGLALCLVSLSLLGVKPAQSQADLAVVLETTPGAGQIGPDETFTATRLQVVDGQGQPVSNAYLKLHLDAPPGNAFISTDFPIVEGTPLLTYEGVLPDGVLEFSYIYPIRGTYNFEVEAGREATTLTFADTLTLDLVENSNEILNFIIFLIILLGLGIVAGFIIGRGARAQQMGTVGIMLALGLGLAFNSVRLVQAHGGGQVSDASPFTETATEGNITVTYGMAPGAGRVGTLNTLNFAATDSQGVLVSETTFDVTLWHIEDEKPVLATALYAPTGETDLAFQFFDGAEHEVRVTASNAQDTATLSRVVEVEGISPPLPAKIKTIVYLVLITFIGILIGLRIQVMQGKRQNLAPVGV